jgi:chitodextrinase
MKLSDRRLVQSLSPPSRRVRSIAGKYGISSITAACSIAIRAAAFALLLGAALPLAAQTSGSSKFIPTFLVYYGGAPALVAADASKLAKFDLLDIDRFRYNQIAPNTWSAVKALNPNIGIYLYEMGPETQNYMDATPQVSINGLGRYNVSRGHSMGALNANHPDFYLLDSSGSRIYSIAFSNVGANQFWHLMDFGNTAYQSYWVEAVRTDVANQPWVADGVHADNCLTFSSAGGYSATSSKYPTDAAWSNAMNSFASGIAAGLHGYGQKLWCNKGSSYTAAGAAAWLALDAGPNPPDVLADEGAFAVTFGPWSTQFFPEANWKSQIDVMGAIRNSKVAMFSSTTLGEGQSGTDNWGQPVTYWQTLWYALGSFLLGKNDTLNNAYFGFFGNGGSYNRIWWYDEYDKIDLGRALGPYTVTAIGGVNIYSREFEKGYVYVNPTASNVATVTLPQASQQLTHGNLLSLLDSIPIVNSISLNGHNAAVLLKTVTVPVVDFIAPTTPTGVSASAVSSSQINLSWIASTDNVGVTGYRVYRAGTLLATLGAVTAYQNTGLTASTSYSYTLQAIDAAGNASAQSASVSATTQAASDTTAPSVPAGLVGTAMSSSQINLSWNPSTDNVGVAGYYVYLNDVALTTTTATSFQHAGLTPGSTYNYRVSAYDAVPNHSAWTATPVSVTTPPAPDTQAPSIPIGLTAAAVSSTQINLSWTASTDNVGVTGYRVYRAGTLLATVGAVTAYQDTGLSASTSYSYTVQAVDAAGNASAQSASVSATTQAAPDTSAPSVPTGLTAAAVSSTQINLSWTASTDNVGVTGYRVYRAGTLLATVGAVTAYQDTGLSASTSYSYTVQAVDAAGNASAQSASVSATTQAAPDTVAPSVPTGPTAAAVSSTQINLSWTASTDNVRVTGYRVYRAGTLLATVGAVTAYQNTGLNGSTNYSYTVQAVDAAGNASAQSASASATTQSALDTTAPTVPTGLTGRAVSTTRISLTWNASTDSVGVKGYIVYLNDVALATTTTRSFTHSGLTAGTIYNYRVSAYDAAGNNSPWTATPVSVRTLASRVIGSDFNSDRKSDILWRNGATGENAIWLMNGTTLSGGVSTNALSDLNWSIAGVGDFNGDGKSDILWHNRATGENAIWLMNGATLSGGAVFATITDANWGIAGVGDFNADGKSDILWHNRATGENAIWLMNGVTISSAATFSTGADLNWNIAGVGDFDGDGKSDIVWRNGATGENAIWLMNGTTLSAALSTNALPDLNYSIAGVGDFNGDGKSDILWHNSTTGENAIWLMNGATLSSGAVFATITDANWGIAGVGDFNADGKSDILWRNRATGENTIYLMNGVTISSSAAIGTVVGDVWSATLR